MKEFKTGCLQHHSDEYSLNICNNLIRIYHNYWSNKISVKTDNSEMGDYLWYSWPFLIDHVISNGLSIILLNYGTKFVVSKAIQILLDSNSIPIAAQVEINQINGSIKTVYAIDYKYFKENEVKKQLETALSIPIDAEINKAIFFQLNVNAVSPLKYLSAYLQKISCLSDIDNKNLEVANVIYTAETDTFVTKKQASNISCVISSDGKGLFLTNSGDKVPGLQNIKASVTTPISNWNNISSALIYWTKEFYEKAGINFQAPNSSRQNILETSQRLSISNSIENEFVNWCKQFITKFNDYYQLKVDLTINSLTSTINQLTDYNNLLHQEGENNEKGIVTN